VQVERVGLYAVELAVSADLWLPLVEVALCSCLAVQLLNLVGRDVKQVAVVRLLIRSRKASENQDMFVRYLVEPAAFQTDPIGVFFDSQV